MDLKGKNVMYVACFGGIGFATCKALLTKNLKNLIILDRIENKEALLELQAMDSNCNVEFFEFDVTMEKSKMQEILENILERISHLDIFIYGAGICNENAPELTFQVNLLGLINMITILLPRMDKSKGNKGGMIANISSVLGLDPFPLFPAYSATKAGIISFTRSLAQPAIYDKTGVSMIAICPGVTNTNIFQNLVTFLDFDPNFTKESSKITGQTPEICGVNIVKAIEEGKNDDIWYLDDGDMKLVEPMKFEWNKTEVEKVLNK